ncbi:hypothetical protein B0F90DRAFT_1738592 [Multifurca ochricompacta]|uniref:Uncharacterized protein n=1 Tax=Multifurca ochricompacta TaxID=376703 RepID=A0AAD4QKQ8_9AGAM|nr:hypothetical protein B0F90DRAFT_1738586 [Multifurca ochricompacta]KAI0297618.1 hypothetical protein B0F90DRAFT_1738592 [Multifurca ochricompacta]
MYLEDACQDTRWPRWLAAQSTSGTRGGERNGDNDGLHSRLIQDWEKRKTLRPSQFQPRKRMSDYSQTKRTEI